MSILFSVAEPKPQGGASFWLSQPRSRCAMRDAILKPVKGIVSRDFGTLFLFYWIDLRVVIGPDQVYFSF
jgi:hypothetical protein